MQTKVRLIEGQYNNSQYRNYLIQILDKRSEYSDSVEVIGTITFQTDKDAEFKDENIWYGLKYDVNTDKPEHLFKMAKIAKFVQDNVSGWRAQPKEVCQVIGAENHFHVNSEFLPVAWVGRHCYNVLRNGEVYTRLYAANRIVAQKELDKLAKKKNWDNATLSETSTELKLV